MPTESFKELLPTFIEQDVSPGSFKLANDSSKRVYLFMYVLTLVSSGKDLVKAIGVTADG